MKRLSFIFALVLSATTGRAGWESSLRIPWLCSSSFEEYGPGSALTNGTAVVGGFWSVPKNADTSAYVVSQDTVAMNVLTSATNGIVLNATSMDVANADKAVCAALKMSGFTKLPEIDGQADRAAIIIYAPEGGEASFQGWSASGWKTLHLASGLVKPIPDEWYDITIRLMSDGAGNAKVQYRIFTGTDYEPLQTEDGKFWLDVIGSDIAVREMEVRGSGGLEYLRGSEMKDGLVIGVRGN